MSKRRSSDSPSTQNKRIKSSEVENESDSESSDQEEDNNLSQRFQCASNYFSDAGIVERITLRNFMCHSLLGPFTFGSNINFVVGNNGSGKSAILTALIVALGGTAQSTNRGSSLKGFVKEGESAANVSVTLRNKGKDSYKAEVYGSYITIDLRITREGIRTYKLKTEAGQIISTKKEELNCITDHFNIQVNNPISILTQEMSKYFLHSKGEGDKYRFFMKATQLEQMRDDYVHITETKSLTEEKVKQHNECLKDLKEKYLEKEDRYKSLKSLDDMSIKLEELQKQMAWATVTEMEDGLQPMKDKLSVDKRSTAKFDEKVDEWKNKTAEADQKYKKMVEHLKDIYQQMENLKPKSDELKAESQKYSKLYKATEVTVHTCRVNLRDLEKDKAQLSSRIKDLKQSITTTTGAESLARTHRMDQIRAELQNLKHQISTQSQQIDQYQHASNRAKEEQGKIKKEYTAVKNSIESKKSHLLTMENSRSNQLRRYGENIPALLAAIQEAHRKGQFKHRPRGPLGYLIKLKDPEQALAIETCLKGQLHAFTCDNFEDEKVLQGIMKKVFHGDYRPGIITSTFLPQIHDTRRRAVNHPKYPTVLQALEIEDPVVANCLIDQRSIESVLLIKDRTEARRVMNIEPPANCLQAFSEDGDQIFTNRTYCTDQKRAKYLSADVEDDIKHLEGEIENQVAQERRFQQHLKKLDEDIKTNESLLRRAFLDQRVVKDKATKLELELTDLQNVEEPQSEDLIPLEEELQEVIEKLSMKRDDYEDKKNQLATLKADYEKAEQEYRTHKEKINNKLEESESIKDELAKSEEEVGKAKHHTKHYEEKRSGHLRNIQTLEDQLNSKEKEIEAAAAKAAQMCPERIKVRRSAKSLDTEINRLKVKISTQQEYQGDSEEIVKQYHEAVQKYKNMSQQMKSLNKFIKSLEAIMQRRLFVYGELRRFLSARCKIYFNILLAQRGYGGSMIFDHRRETLSISVQPCQENTVEVNDMRSLSGGERSFSTVCFVLSLWGITEAPFRCLDEIDIYMDMVNRRISMDMMMKVASGQRFRQFIFLTPQHMSSLPVTKMIRILRLKDPERDKTDSQKSQNNPQ